MSARPERTSTAGDGQPAGGVARPVGSAVLLDGAMGTELIARGVCAPEPLWSAWAVLHAPRAVADLHRQYAAAGASIHTANTFRTTPRALGDRWQWAARRAVELARSAVGVNHRVAGSMAPLEDCYRPDQSPRNPGPEHRTIARALVDAGVDLLLCETFAHPGEAQAAVEAAVATGAEVWVALTAGPRADLLDERTLAETAARCVALGAAACLVNCVPAHESTRFLEGLLPLPVPVGVYANAGDPAVGLGWTGNEAAARRYASVAEGWLRAGASIVGGCCGTSPSHIRALSQLAGGPAPGP